VSEGEHLDLWQNARLFALLNAAEADGYVASWATKYHYRFWRPITAIREAANDNNPGPRPTRPGCRCGPRRRCRTTNRATPCRERRRPNHEERVRPQRHRFDACSLSLPEGKCGEGNAVRRHFSSFDQAAIENGESRILAGFHFRDAVEKGIAHGRQVAQWAVNHSMQPLSGNRLAERGYP
jgi:hypothetical protein